MITTPSPTGKIIGPAPASELGDAGDSGDMHCLNIAELKITDFRNYTHASLDLGPSLVVLTGENGAGKTNLLEAVSLLVPGRGMRRVQFGDIARASGSGSWAVSAEINGPQGTNRIGTGLTNSPQARTQSVPRTVRINGENMPGSGALGELMRVLWLTPAMDRLFTGPASDRRRFFDRLVLAIDPEHGTRVNAYEKLMRDRNKLLADNTRDHTWLDALELQMAEAGIAVAAARVDACSVLSELITSSKDNFSKMFPRAQIAIEGEIETGLKTGGATEIEDKFRKTLYDSRRKDQIAGRTLIGPHRSELVVHHSEKNMAARLCSTGEQKALLISIILAQARLVKLMFEGYAPVLLLDEVAAHLDVARRAALFDTLTLMGIQAWMTGTERALFETLPANAQIYNVSEGSLQRLA